MANVEFKLNVTPLLKRVAHIKKNLMTRPERTVKNVGRVFIKEYKRGVPVKTGRLKRGVGRGKEGIYEFKKTSSEITLKVGTRVPYAAPVNFGFTHYKSKKLIRGKFFFNKAVIKAKRIARRISLL